ncbi:helix-turn-helix domain-containing protein [Leisingera sp. ANG59]|uniref:helix-turn-helix domain-containing protein n=1 Tax=Leisingera sp. ANG59 TaxID=2675221 RepID=UPI00157273F0|nr:helix-turn-helix domain-containing protein [Leisingera sp. ANG59]NSY36848.1 helix-turn-helix domain-containing protein [Leisingera sp. ANG59]
MSQRIRIRRRSGYSTIPNAVIRDTSITAEARLMLCYIMSCSEEWVFYREKSMEILGCKKDKYQRIIRELKAAGYLIIRPKQGADGRLDGYEWEVIDEPSAHDGGEQAGNAPQDVVGATSHREPEKPAHGENSVETAHREPEKPARRLDPPAGKTGPLRKNNKQKEKQISCAADAPHKSDFDFDGFFGEFVSVYPRMGDPEATEESLREALGAGADPKEILAGARAYAVEQLGNKPRFIKYSENWIDEKRWRQHVTAPVESVDPQKVLEARAQEIRDRKPWARTIKPSQAGECIAAGLVSAADCQAAGINV